MGGAGSCWSEFLGLLIVYVWVGGTTYILFLLLGFFGVLRVKRQQEEGTRSRGAGRLTPGAAVGPVSVGLVSQAP